MNKFGLILSPQIINQNQNNTQSTSFRLWQGKIITGTTSRFITNSAIAAEAQAYREALILIRNLQMDNCLIETDCLLLVQAIKARMPIAEADAIIRDIFQLLDEAPDVGATWTPREGNNVAHQLAAMAVGNKIRRQWIFDPPNQIRNTIRTEARFATHQHNQQIHKQLKGVSGPTNHQGYQLENGLPEREETKIQDNQQAEVGMQQRSTVVLQPASENSNHKLDSGRGVYRGIVDGSRAAQSSGRQRINGEVNTIEEGTSSRQRIHYQGRQQRRSAMGGRSGDPMLTTGICRSMMYERCSLQIHASTPSAHNGDPGDIGNHNQRALNNMSSILRSGH
ncbi:hypothetical protein Ahy_A07g030983 [Arachis hypogaea]|uniref:RNase H type-1 domain-containing protein n=1 Tax=Arachis hypogaea TaxID=3818 RepID=A0A445C2H1_ARAHY|nr:hypothetical protein Ahy_A07g030983 [Arachis hypogaea]